MLSQVLQVRSSKSPFLKLNKCEVPSSSPVRKPSIKKTELAGTSPPPNHVSAKPKPVRTSSPAPANPYSRQYSTPSRKRDTSESDPSPPASKRRKESEPVVKTKVSGVNHQEK